MNNTMNESNGKKRVKLTKVEELPANKRANIEGENNVQTKNKEANEEKLEKVNKDDNVESKEKFATYSLFPGSTCSSKQSEVNALVQEYITSLLAGISKYSKNVNKFHYTVEMFINTLEKIKKEYIEFIDQLEFANLLTRFADEINNCLSLDLVINSNCELLIELQRRLVPAKTDEKRTHNPKQLVSEVQKLTKAMKTIQAQIDQLETKEIDMLEGDKETIFTQMPKLHSAMYRLWRKRETLLNRSTEFIGRALFKAFTYTKTKNIDVDQIISRFFMNYITQKSKSKKEFFTIIELKQHIENQIELKKIDFILTDELLDSIYRDLVKEHKKRRHQDYFDTLRSYEYKKHLKPIESVDFNDPIVVKKLEENDKLAEDSMENILKRYHDIDVMKNGEINFNVAKNKPLGWDDHTAGADDLDEEEDESEVDEEEEEEIEGNVNGDDGKIDLINNEEKVDDLEEQSKIEE